MAGEPAAEIQLLRSQKAKLIEILSADAEFVLQHADSSLLLSDSGYQQVKARTVPREKVTDLLDHIIQRGPAAAQGLLELLKGKEMQETFPMLCFIKDVQAITPSTGGPKPVPSIVPHVEKEVSSLEGSRPCNLEDTVPSKKIRKRDPVLVKDKQLMIVAPNIGKSWKEIGIGTLDIPNKKLEQIELDESRHIYRVFSMLLYWKTSQKLNATAANLHTLLSQGPCALPLDSINSLLEDSDAFDL
ncbi:uncharacterized protein zgc:174906 [Pungitius pungitius]|uniref:uncharacterized protein zgc:174906 n=1 Tax=Pungitius pungitius TaxID=134920 RepID=UPI002E12C2D4